MGFRVTKIQRKDWNKRYGDNWNTNYKKDVVALGGFTCSKCGREATPDNPIQRDHIINKSKGGNNARINLRRLCLRCHRKRHTRQKF